MALFKTLATRHPWHSLGPVAHRLGRHFHRVVGTVAAHGCSATLCCRRLQGKGPAACGQAGQQAQRPAASTRAAARQPDHWLLAPTCPWLQIASLAWSAGVAAQGCCCHAADWKLALPDKNAGTGSNIVNIPLLEMPGWATRCPGGRVLFCQLTCFWLALFACGWPHCINWPQLQLCGLLWLLHLHQACQATTVYSVQQ